MPKKKITPLNEDFDLKLFAFIAKKNFLWFVSFIFLSFVIAFLWLRYNPPVYEAGAIIKLSTENQADKVLNINREFFIEQSNNQMAGDIELIRSKIIAERAAAKLQLNVSYYAKGTVLDFESYKSSPFTVEAVIKDSSVYYKRYYLEFDDKSSFTLSFSEKATVKSSSKYKINEWIDLPEVKFKVLVNDFANIKNQQSQFQKGGYYFVFNRHDDIARRISASLTVSVVNPEAKTISIKLKDKNSNKAADIVNMVAKEFIEYDVDKSREVTNKIIEFIDQTIFSVDKDLSSSEGSIEDFRRMNKLMDPALMVGQLSSKIWELNNSKIDLQLDMNIFDNLEKDVLANKEISTMILTIVGKYKEGQISQAINTLQEMVNYKDKVLVQSTPESQGFKAAELQMENQKALLINIIRNQKSALNDQLKKIDDQIVQFGAMFNTMPGKQAEYSRLERVFSINEKFYSLLLEKKAEFSIAFAGFVPKNILLEPASAFTSPVSPNKTLVLSVCLMLGFLASFILIIVRYLVYNEVSSLEEVELYTDAALLGIIPKYKREIPISQLLVDKNPKSVIAEAFRSIRTNLQFISNAEGSK